MKKPFAKSCVCLIAVLGGIGPALAAPDPSGVQIIRDSGVSAGLAVHLGTTDGSLEIELIRLELTAIAAIHIRLAPTARSTLGEERARRVLARRDVHGAAEVADGDW